MKVGIIALIVVFQPELENFSVIGSTNIRGKSILGKMKFKSEQILMLKVLRRVRICLTQKQAH